MKKIYILLIAALSCNFVSFAQNDMQAKKILDAVSTKVKTFRGITANFSIKSVTSKGKSNGIKAGFIMVKGQKYLLKQGKTEIKSDGIKTYNFDGSKTITITPVEESNQTLTPQNLLSNFYDKDFTYKLVSTAGQFNEIELLPVDKRKNFQKVDVYIDKGKGMITKAHILDKSNNVLEFIMTNLNTNATIADNTFIFDRNKYPKDAEVLD